ncbi:hypothetical protein [Helicobacter rodentium]|nr:hypothetical protein [Helicobacter rodentium]
MLDCRLLRLSLRSLLAMTEVVVCHCEKICRIFVAIYKFKLK